MDTPQSRCFFTILDGISTGTPIVYAIPILAFLLLLAAGSWFWFRTLKRQVAQASHSNGRRLPMINVLLKQVRAEKPDLPVLILTIYPEAQYAVRALRAGASGYLTKESLPEELIKAIRTVSQGRRYVSASLAEKLAFDLTGNAEGPLHETLSDREYQVLCLIASGRTPTEIAEDLSLSIKTISTYRARVMEKMGMRTSAELTRYAVQNRLAD